MTVSDVFGNRPALETSGSGEDAWRYTPVAEILARMDGATAADRTTDVAATRAVVDALAGAAATPRLVFVNGFYDAGLSDLDGLPPGLQCRFAGPHAEGGHVVRDLVADDAIGDHDVAVVIVAEGVRFDHPVHVVHVAVPNVQHAHPSVICHPRTVIDVGAGARLAVIETFCGLDGATVASATVTSASTMIRIGDRAELDQCRLQIEPATATHIGHTRVEQGQGSQLRMTSITLGGEIARNAIDVHLEHPDTRAELSGIDMAAGYQRHDTAVTIDHAASRCASSQRFVGVVDDHGRVSFSGEIVVRPGTVGTDAHQSNRNLVLDPNAEADTRPWLRILADDVSCTHGATVGRLDDDALFYLRSRGIPLATARAMLIDAFTRDVIDAIAHESVRAHITASGVAVAIAAPVPATSTAARS